MFEPTTAREALLEIRRRIASVGNRLAVEDLDEIAADGLDRSAPPNFELTDQLADRLAESHDLLTRIKSSVQYVEGGTEIAELLSSISVALALPPDIDAMVDRRLGRARPDDKIMVVISVEGAKSFVSDSSGWGAMGLQEITEEIVPKLSALGIEPPYRPKGNPANG